MSISYGDWLHRRGHSKTTIASREQFHRARARDWGQIAEQPAEDLARWLACYQGWTKLTYHTQLVSLYDWLVEIGELEVNPVRMIQRPPAPKGHPRPLAETDLRRALTAATPQVRAYLMLGYLAGLRAHEIAKVHGSDVTESAFTILGKGGQLAQVPTHPLLWELAQHYPRDGFWFPSPTPHREFLTAASITGSVRSLFRSLGIAGSSHRARHTYGTTMLRNGINVRVIQTLLRHRSLETTERYLGVDEDERVAAIRTLAA